MPLSSPLLSIANHDRDRVGMTYVYPVVSRRARGVSIGINLNSNNACNWHCIYCQVPNLTRGGPPPINLAQLEQEFETLLLDILQGDFMQRQVPEEARRLSDIAFSGNGEPTAAPEFPQALAIISAVLKRHGLTGTLPVRLITNGSQLHLMRVQHAIRALAEINGEVWFKVDAAKSSGYFAINAVRMQPAAVLRRLKICASLCRTWVQTCLFEIDGVASLAADDFDYLNLLAEAAPLLAGVHLYGIARPSMQEGAGRLKALPAENFSLLAAQLKKKGLTVQISP